MNRTAKILLFSGLTALLVLWAGYFLGHVPSVQDALIRQFARQALRGTCSDLLDKNRRALCFAEPGRRRRIAIGRRRAQRSLPPGSSSWLMLVRARPERLDCSICPRPR